MSKFSNNCWLPTGYYYSRRNKFAPKNLSQRTKLGLYSTYIVPVLTYTSESRALSKSNETLFVAFERKMLRKILGSVCVEEQWRSRYNDELYEMYGDLTVVLRIKLPRLRWAGHVVRMETDYPARKLFLGHPQRQRRSGRPKLRLLGIKAWITDWQTKARDLGRFRAFLDKGVSKLIQYE